MPNQTTSPIQVKVKLRFNTTQEVLADPKFREFLKKRIDEIETNRDTTLDQAYRDAQISKEIKLKRSPYEYLTENNLLNIDSIITEQLLIENKTSQLPSAVREYIERLCLIAAQKTISYYHEIDNPIPTHQKK